MKVLFFIRTTAKDKTKPVKIRVRLRDGSNISIFGDTRQRITPGKWNAKKERPDWNKFASGETSEYDRLKENLNTINKAIETAYQREPDKENLNSDWLNEVIDRALFPHKYDENLSLYQFIEKFIKDSIHNPNPKTGVPVSYKQRRLYEQTFVDIPVMLTPHSGDIDPLLSNGSKNEMD